MGKKYVVVSLFNGMGCCFVALEQAGVEVSQKISSEVDKYAIKSNDAMFPDTIQVGDVRKIEVVKNENGKPIQLKTENGIIDLLDDEIILAGGSPCQSFSMAGKMKGMVTKDEIEVLTLEHYLKLKEQGFEFEGQSYLFWEYMRLKRELNPKYFLLENVIMVEKWYNVLTRAIGLNAIRINASLVSAQNRDRYFWTNIYTQPQGLFGYMECMIPQPKDKGILLKDILETDVPEKYFLKHPKFGFDGMNLNDKGKTLHTGGKSSQTDKHNYDIIKIDVEGNPKKNQEKAGCLTGGGHSGGNHSDMDLLIVKDVQCVAMRGRNPNNPSDRTTGAPTEQRLEPRTDGKTNTLTTVSKDNLVKEKENYIQWEGNGFDQDNRAYYEDGKSGTLDTKGNRTKVLLNETPKKGKNKKGSKDKKSQVEKVLDKTGVDIGKVTEPTILDVYNKKLKEDGKCITLTDPCHNNLRLVVPVSYPPDYPEYMKPLESELTEDETGSIAYWERIAKYEKENNIIKTGASWPSPRTIKQINPSTESGDKQPYQQNRVYDADGISPALCADKSDLLIKGGDFRTDEGFRWRDNGKTGTLAARARTDESCGQLANINSRIRRLTPRECGRLQSFPEDKLDILLGASVSDSQLYRQFGNGWNCVVISHIFSYIK